MPKAIKQGLQGSREDMGTYIAYWANCMDYGYGQQDMEATLVLKPRAQQLFNAAHAELLGANSQLLETLPNVKAILGLRMATEIYLKAVLVQEKDLTAGQLMKISHKLEDAAIACGEATSMDEFKRLRSMFHSFHQYRLATMDQTGQ